MNMPPIDGGKNKVLHLVKCSLDDFYICRLNQNYMINDIYIVEFQ